MVLIMQFSCKLICFTDRPSKKTVKVFLFTIVNLFIGHQNVSVRFYKRNHNGPKHVSLEATYKTLIIAILIPSDVTFFIMDYGHNLLILSQVS